MPRIPVRVEPYSSPSRQQRHYKNKRDHVLRALGKAAYINGSHFAIMWVSARGDVETYASQALQSRLEDWFVKGGIADEAKQIVQRQSGEIGGSMSIFEDHAGEEQGEEDKGEQKQEQEQEQEDVLLDPTTSNADKGEGTKARRGRPLAPLNTAIANQHFLRSRSSFPHSTGMVWGNSISSPPTPHTPTRNQPEDLLRTNRIPRTTFRPTTTRRMQNRRKSMDQNHRTQKTNSLPLQQRRSRQTRLVARMCEAQRTRPPYQSRKTCIVADHFKEPQGQGRKVTVSYRRSGRLDQGRQGESFDGVR